MSQLIRNPTLADCHGVLRLLLNGVAFVTPQKIMAVKVSHTA